MVPVQVLSLKHDVGNHGEHSKTYAFLHHLELNKRKRTTVAGKSHAVCRNLTAIFEESDCPGECDDTQKRPVVAYPCLLQFKMSVPGNCHKDITQYEQYDCIKTVHLFCVSQLPVHILCRAPAVAHGKYNRRTAAHYISAGIYLAA